MALLKRKRIGLGDAMSVVTRFVNACNRHDADGVYACLHPEFDSIQPMYPSRNFRGADQVRRNWQAIFDAEPGFRLTVLRSAVMEDTVWLELHGAGEDAEVAGVFVMGIQGDRIRWARIYSALVEPVQAAADAPPAPLREVPPLEDSPAASGNGEGVEEALIAPVVDIEGSGRRRRRSRSRGEHEAPAPVADEATEAVPIVEETAAEPEPAVEPEPPVEPEAEAAAFEAEPEPLGLAEALPEGDGAPPPVEAEAEPAAEAEPDQAQHAEPVPVPEDVVEAVVQAEPEAATEPEPAPEPQPEKPAGDDPPKWRFGKKR
jgi:ketosteroid isomerase-like protein